MKSVGWTLFLKDPTVFVSPEWIPDGFEFKEPRIQDIADIKNIFARIRELENPGETPPSVQLHDPRRHGTASAGPSRMVTPAGAGLSGVPLYPTMAPPTGETRMGPRYHQSLMRLRTVLTAHIPDPTPQEVQML